jgi:hypothetical protein
MRTGAAGLERSSVAMLRVLGAGSAWLVLAQPSDATAQAGLGLNTPAAAEVEMEPVLLQCQPNGEQLLAITTRGIVRRALNGTDGVAAVKLLEASLLRAGETTYRILSVTVKRFGGMELLYEMEIEE